MTRLRPLIVMGSAVLALSWAVAPAGAQHFPPPPTGPVGFNTGANGVNYAVDNFAYSPNIRKFVDALPGLGLPGCSTAIPAGTTGSCNQNGLGQYIPVADNRQNTLYPDADYYSIGIGQYSLRMHSDLPATTLRGYYQIAGAGNGQSSDAAIGGVHQYLGPLILARSFDPTKPVKASGNGAPVRILFQNNLPVGAAGKIFLPVDTTLMGAGMGPVGTQNYTTNRANIHLHGGNTPWISDGTPHQWIVPAGETSIPAGTAYDPYRKGAAFQNVPDMVGTGKSIPAPAAGDGLGTLYWTNQQSQRLMFYHDHAYGITRLQVYGGLAAGYLLTDQAEDNMINTGVVPNQSDLGAAYNYGIPLVIQDKSFVNDASTPTPGGVTTPTAKTLTTDPLWSKYVGTTGGNLWFPHEYMPNENIFDPSGTLNWGRWDYGPWLNPPTVPLNSILPSPSHVPETFADTMIVNGTAFPYVNVQPKAYRFRVLSAGNDRALNLQFYVAASRITPTTPGTTGAVLCTATSGALPQNCTEVKMVPATEYPSPAFCNGTQLMSQATGLPINCTPTTWPTDGRNGGVPDPLTAGPQIIQIGNEGGILPQAVTIPAQPIDFEYSRRVPTILNVSSQALLLMPAERADIIVDFSAFAGQTLILYNDAPAPMPLFDERNDHYTGSPDYTAIGGAPSTPAGYGPNTRTVMQIRVAAAPVAAPFNLAALQAALPVAYKATQAPPIVKQAAYNAAFGTSNKDTFVQNVDATVNLTGIGQAVSSVKVTLPGSGYVRPPTVSFVPMDGNGSGARATACLNGVGAVTVTAAGAGYTTTPTVTFTNPAGVTGSGAAAVTSLNGGGVSAITVTNPGCSYTGNPNMTVAAPPCTINGTTCVQATAAANVTLGAVGSVTVNSGGTGYTKAPFVFLTPVTGDPGRGATADAMLAGDTVIGMKNITEGFEPWYGRMNVQLGTTAVPLDTVTPAPQVPGIAMYIDPPSDFMNDGQVQVFRIAHLGVDSHIIHFHLVNLQVVNRVDFTNTMFPPLPNEVGWKESIRTNPFTDLVVATKPVSQWLPFQIPQSNRLMDVTTPAGSTANYIQPAPVAGLANPAGISNVMTNFGWEYVWHCHLLGHEENDMMRPIVFNVPVPPAPTGLTATAVAVGQVNLSWTGATNTNARTYTIERSTSQTFTSFTTLQVVGFPPPTTASDTGITTAGTYYYRVRAENGAGVSAWSSIATVVMGPVLKLSATTLPFANQVVATSSLPLSVTVSNTGFAPMTITSINATGTDAAMFAINNGCVSPLAPLASCQVSVTFTPTSVGAHAATLNVNVAAPGTSGTVALSGTGLAAPTFLISGAITPVVQGKGATITVTLGTAVMATATAAANGTYSVAVPNGTYTVTPTKAGVTFTPTSASVVVSGLPVANINFTGAGMAIDVTVSANSSGETNTITSPAFTTAAAGEEVLAFIGATSFAAGTTVTGVSGGGLTWTLLKRNNGALGTAEIWGARATAIVTGATVTATLALNVPTSITIVSVAGANATAPIGAVGGVSAGTGAPSATITTVGTNSLVFGVGEDWASNTAPTPGPNQTILSQYLPNNSGTLWVQVTNSAVSGAVTISDTAPTAGSWNLSVVEVKP